MLRAERVHRARPQRERRRGGRERSAATSATSPAATWWRSSRPPLFDDAATSQPGDIVGPVRSAFGWHVIRFVDRRASGSERVAAVEAALAAPDADFATVAEELSDGAEAADGGDIGWRTLDELDAQTLEAIAPLAVGDHSEPLETERGYVILEKLDEGRRPLDAAAGGAASRRPRSPTGTRTSASRPRARVASRLDSLGAPLRPR